MKAKLDRLAARLSEARAERVLLLPHVGADGDAIGSSLALARVLGKLGRTVDVVAEEAVPDLLRFIPAADTIIGVGDLPAGARYDLALLVDCHEAGRAGRRAPLYEAAAEKGAIDHHVFDVQPGPLDVIDVDASSTSELVFELVSRLEAGGGRLFDTVTADQLMAGIISDTGRFSYSNVTAATFRAAAALMAYEPDIVTASFELFDRIDLPALRMKGLVYARVKSYRDGAILTSTVPLSLIRACGSTEYDLNTIPAELRKVSDVAVVFLIRETAEAGEIRVNIRTDERVNAATLAKRFGGGGHARAAGLTLLQSTLAEAETQMVAAAEQELAASGDD